MSDQDLTPYDEVPYPGHPRPSTHPDRLCAIATIFGMRPAPASGCRVLELGCGDGQNIIPMAYQLPNSQFLGIDLSKRGIEIGAALIKKLGLTNIQLQHLSLMDIAADHGKFDYIIAHGVYSWVPPDVRAKILGIFKSNLAPHGVGFVSYNAHPGSHLRDIARDIMLYHTRGISDPREKVGQARVALELFARTIPADRTYARAVAEQTELVGNISDNALYHDHLAPSATAFLFHQVIDAAKAVGLQYLSEATFGQSSRGTLPTYIAGFLDKIPESEIVLREQYFDFFTARMFHETLLCHDDVDLRTHIQPQCVANYYIAGEFTPEGDPIDTGSNGVTTFKAARGSTLATDHGPSKQALVHLGRMWPRAVSFRELLSAAGGLGASAGEVATSVNDEVDKLTTLLFRAFAGQQLELYVAPPRLTTAICERPEASLLARTQATMGTDLTTLRHGTVSLRDGITRRFIQLVDGTRSCDELVLSLANALEPKDGALHEGAALAGQIHVTRNQVEENLELLASLALLVA